MLVLCCLDRICERGQVEGLFVKVPEVDVVLLLEQLCRHDDGHVDVDSLRSLCGRLERPASNKVHRGGLVETELVVGVGLGSRVWEGDGDLGVGGLLLEALDGVAHRQRLDGLEGLEELMQTAQDKLERAGLAVGRAHFGEHLVNLELEHVVLEQLPGLLEALHLGQCRNGIQRALGCFARGVCGRGGGRARVLLGPIGFQILEAAVHVFIRHDFDLAAVAIGLCLLFVVRLVVEIVCVGCELDLVL